MANIKVVVIKNKLKSHKNVLTVLIIHSYLID